MMKAFPDIPLPGEPDGFTLSNPSGHEIPITHKEFEQTISLIEKKELVQYHTVELVYVNENEIVTINREHLGRGYVTDIITFRYDEDTGNSAIEGTLFCCAPRIAEQGREFGADSKTEFLRIFVHGLLHLAGYDDQTAADKEKMTVLENHYLEQINLLH